MSFDLSEEVIIKAKAKVTLGANTKTFDVEWDGAIEAIEGETLRDQAKRSLIRLHGIVDKGVALDPVTAAEKAWEKTWLADALTGAFNEMRDRNFRQGKSA